MTTKLFWAALFSTLVAVFPAYADEPAPPANASAKSEATPTPAPEPAPQVTPVQSSKAPPPSPWGFHGGINLRTDLGTHPVRIDGGVRYKQLDFALVLDPMYFLDQQSSTDLLAMWRGKNGFSPVMG